MKRTAGVEIERLIQLLAKLPGLGPRSARRAALYLIKNREKLLVAPVACHGRRPGQGDGVQHLRQCRYD